MIEFQRVLAWKKEAMRVRNVPRVGIEGIDTSTNLNL